MPGHTIYAAIISLSLLATACSHTHSPCGDGTSHLSGRDRICAYQSGVVIEGGFECPDFAPALIEIEGGYVCAPEPIDPEDLPKEVCSWNADGCRAPKNVQEPDAGTIEIDAGPAAFQDAALEPFLDSSITCDCGDDAQCPGGAAQSKCVACTCLPYPATCFDGVKNRAETDVDCGGGDCPRCYAGQTCKLREDCATGKCGSESGSCDALSSDEIGCLGLDVPACAGCHAVGDRGVNLWPTTREGVVPPPPAGVVTDGLVASCL